MKTHSGLERLCLLCIPLMCCGTADEGGLGETDSPSAWSAGKYIAPEAVYQRVVEGDSDLFLLNVSDEEFYSMGHIEGTVAIPWDILDTRLDDVPPSRHVVVYCRRGVRSESGYETLIANDYSAVWIMEGGLESWIDLGFPTAP